MEISDWLIKEHQEEDRTVRLNALAMVAGGTSLFGAVLAVTSHLVIGLSVAAVSFLCLGLALHAIFRPRA
jgi:hypothetical protein